MEIPQTREFPGNDVFPQHNLSDFGRYAGLIGNRQLFRGVVEILTVIAQVLPCLRIGVWGRVRGQRLILLQDNACPQSAGYLSPMSVPNR